MGIARSTINKASTSCLPNQRDRRQKKGFFESCRSAFREVQCQVSSTSLLFTRFRRGDRVTSANKYELILSPAAVFERGISKLVRKTSSLPAASIQLLVSDDHSYSPADEKPAAEYRQVTPKPQPKSVLAPAIVYLPIPTSTPISIRIQTRTCSRLRTRTRKSSLASRDAVRSQRGIVLKVLEVA